MITVKEIKDHKFAFLIKNKKLSEAKLLTLNLAYQFLLNQRTLKRLPNVEFDKDGSIDLSWWKDDRLKCSINIPSSEDREQDVEYVHGNGFKDKMNVTFSCHYSIDISDIINSVI